MSAPRVSVIIPSYNQVDTVVRCIESLADQTLSPHEIIVVDSSTNDTPTLIRERFPHVRLVRREERTRPGDARNLGVRHASGDLFAFIDTDCVADPDWLERLADAWDPVESPVVMGAVVNGTPDSAIGTTGYLYEFSEFLPEWPESTRHHGVSCNLLIDEARFAAAGGFPTGIFPGEDTLFTFALHRMGHSLRFEPRARVVHMNRTRLRELLHHQLRLGASFARIRRIEPNLPGAHLLGRSWILPFLPGVRWLRMLLRLSRLGHPRHLWTCVLLAPLSLFALGAWTLGVVSTAEGDPG